MEAQPVEPQEPTTPFWARCAGCDHTWIAAYYPMEARAFCRIAARAICPKCGGKAMVAEQAAGVLIEPTGAPA